MIRPFAFLLTLLLAAVLVRTGIMEVPGKPAPSRLRVAGTRFQTAGHQPFEWRGISAFRLVEMVARGREPEAVAFLDWAAGRRITIVRTFLMARHLFRLEPGDGLAALPRLLRLAADRGLYVEVVALVDTAAIGVDLPQHLKALGAIVAEHQNAVVELANEPWHPTQDQRLHNPANLRPLAALIPAGVPVAFGSAETDDGYAAGHFVTWHAPRGSDDEGWEHVLLHARGADLLEKWQKPTISDEPIGAGPAWIAGRRDNSPERFGAGAAVTRLAGLGATFHYEGGLYARVPEGPELACLTAWQSALDLLSDLPEGGKFLSGSELAGHAVVADARAAFARQDGNRIWVIAVDPGEKAAVSFAGGWQLQSTKDGPGFRLFSARR